MKRTWIALAASAALLAPAAAAGTSVEPRPVVIWTSIEGELSEAMIATVDRAIREAEDREAAHLVVEIDTPGGEVTIMDRIGMRLGQTKVEPVAYVAREAVSAGSYIAMACERIYTSEHAQIGSAHPVAVAPFGLADPTGQMDSGYAEKVMSYLRSKFRDMAQSHDRPGMTALAEAMVDQRVEVLLVSTAQGERPMTREEYDDIVRQGGPGAARVVKTIDGPERLLNMTAAEAFEYGFSDGIVASREELLETLGAADAEVIEVRPSWSERLAGRLEHVRWILLIAGLVLLYVEIKTPGFGLPGFLGILCLGALLFRNYLVGLAEIPEILLVVLGIVLLAIEVFVLPGFGIAGISGIVCIALGIVFSFLPFFWPEGPAESELLGETIRGFSLSLVASLAGAYALSRFVLPRTPLFRRLILDSGMSPTQLLGSAASLESGRGRSLVAAGARGHAATDLRPAGKVEIDGAQLDARSEGEYIERGAAVIVARVAANHVVVRAEARGAVD